MIKVYTLVRTPWFSWLDTQKEFKAGNVTEVFLPGDLKDLNFLPTLDRKSLFKTIFDSALEIQEVQNNQQDEQAYHCFRNICSH